MAFFRAQSIACSTHDGLPIGVIVIPSLMYASFMASKTLPKRETPEVTDEEAIRRYAVIERAIRKDEHYLADEMESAIGMYTLGFHYGWKVMQLIHTKNTVAKYEALLGIKIREEFDEFGPDAPRTTAYKIIKSVSSFWRLLSGDLKSPITGDKRVL